MCLSSDQAQGHFLSVQMAFWWLINFGIFLFHFWQGFSVGFARISEVSMKLNEKKHKLMNCSALPL